MKLVLVRHGHPDEDDDARRHDPPLSAKGHAQAKIVASCLAREHVTRIVSSPLRRAVQTAQPLAERLGLRVDIIEGWAEVDRHAARYRSPETLRALGDVEWSRFLNDPVGYFGGDMATFRASVLEAFAVTTDEVDRHTRVAVFTHGLPINVVLSHALSLRGITHFAPGYASLTRLRVGRTRLIGVSSVNDRGHLLALKHEREVERN